ncbi:sensor histidine kinase [Nonomuraea jiangxiensis]|uniref:histidine kinase n=1 Tax=Nonomuraea jiangxiensis TaxID=633440 RepID=A0A1G9HMU3_9ACTN|nr:histidine kinase [Nonomuraea jiangxiensis]SDL14185.1 Signal transduction histidine kinase [Nonomuraea jiangxiensis]
MKLTALWAGVAFAIGIIVIASGGAVDRGVPEWVQCVPLAITCVGVVVRQRAPLACLGLGVLGMALDGFVGPSLATVLVFTDNLYAAALYGPARFARVLLGVTTVLAVAGGAVAGFFGEDWRLLATAGVQVALVLVLPVTTALVLREQRNRAAAERVRAEQVAHLAELDRQAAIAAERTRMARELHDMIANHFSAIAIQSTGALSREDLDRTTIRKVMESVRENSVKGLSEMRAIIGLLRQEGDEPEATRPRLADAETLVDRVRQAELSVDFRVEGEPRELPVSVDLAGYRILQEALTNALKHGDSPVTVGVSYEAGSVSVTVDNAVGGRGARLPGAGAGAGVIGMRERAALVGGAFEAGPQGLGWRVAARLPTSLRTTYEARGGGVTSSALAAGGSGTLTRAAAGHVVLRGEDPPVADSVMDSAARSGSDSGAGSGSGMVAGSGQ